LCAAASVAIAAGFAAPALAFDNNPSGPTEVLPVPPLGGSIVNPDTGASEAVAQIVSPVSVLTDQNNLILLVDTVGDTFTQGSITWTVQSFQVDGVTGKKTVTITDNESTPVTKTVDRVETGTLPSPTGTTGGDAGGTFTAVIPAGNHVYSELVRGSNGGDGHAGGGVKVCIPYIGCATIAYSPSAGDAGGNGPTISKTLTGNYSSIDAKLPGISIVSAGGNGGAGRPSASAFRARTAAPAAMAATSPCT
jgi:hypothetical protein